MAAVLLPCLATQHKGLCHLDLRVREVLERESEDAEAAMRTMAKSYGLSELTNLSCLKLSRGPESGDTDISEYELASVLPELSALEHLDLAKSYYVLCDKVLSSLSVLTRLTPLHLQDSEIKSDSAPVLVSSLRSLTMLEFVDMSENSLGGWGQQLANALRKLKRLRSVSLCEVGLDYGEETALIKALERILRLKMLNLTGSVSNEEYYEGITYEHSEDDVEYKVEDDFLRAVGQGGSASCLSRGRLVVLCFGCSCQTRKIFFGLVHFPRALVCKIPIYKSIVYYCLACK